MQRMKIVTVFVATTIVLIGISATVTQAAPMQSMANSDLKHQLLKSIINRALIQQKDSHSNKDKELAATFCKLLFSFMRFLGVKLLNLEGVSEREYCRNIEPSPEPGPVNSLADAYQVFFNILKDSGMDSMFRNYIVPNLKRIG